MQVKFAFNLSRVYEHYQRKKFAIISAYRSDLLAAVNEQRSRDLKKAVRSLGYGYQEIKGFWKEELGSETGNVSIEWSLFIPEVSYDDALQLGRGQWPGGDDISQFSIIWADGQDLQELQVNVDPPVIVKKFVGFSANKPGPGGAEELQKIWQGYSEHRKRPWTYVEWTMGAPPSKDSPDLGERRAAARWHDRDEHPFYPRAERPYLLYRGALYRPVRVEKPRLPKAVVALLRKKFRAPSFATDIKIPDKISRNWDINPDDVLESTVKFTDGAKATRFSWHPTTGEFLLSDPADMHAQTIRKYGSHQFDEYVRGLVLPKQGVIATRPWVPDPDFGMLTGDPEEDRAQQFMLEQASKASQEACRHALTTVGGVPAKWKWQFDVSNADLQDMTGIYRW